MDEQTLREKIRDYIKVELIRDPDYPLTDDEGIISGGLMDSFALADFSVFVEDEFGVYIPDPDLTVEKMDTLNLMVARVLRDLQ
jgi:acyl carrier protein